MRSWLRRRVISSDDVEDLVQECYCRLAQLRDVTHIEQPRAYFFAIARNLLQRQLKAARVIRIEAIAELGIEWASDQPSPERVAAGRHELARVQAALATLSDRARRIFVMRKIDGLTQRDIARELNVSESVVENDASRSLRTVLRLLTEPEPQVTPVAQGEGVDRVRAR